MLQRYQCLRVIPSLSTVIQKFRHDIFITKFCTKSDNDVHNESKDELVTKLLNESATYSDMNNTEWATTPYPASMEDTGKQRKSTVDPSSASIILFPGQGTIKVGQAKQYMKFPRARELFDIANHIVGYDLKKMCLHGPQHLLNRTEFNQPATVVMSLAALEKLKEERPKAIESCAGIAGYSVGELTGLIFSGAIPYEEGLKLVAVRGTAMQSASEMCSQGMLSCYCTPTAKPGIICDTAQKWALDLGAPNPLCKIAIYLYTQGKVFAGSDEALKYIEQNGQSLGLRKIQRLHVSGAFHTRLMEPALKSFVKALNKTPFVEPNVPVYSNLTTNCYTDNDIVNRKYIIKQIVSPVKWEQIMHKLYERPEGTKFPRTFDMGSGGTLKTVLRMINAKASDECYIY